MGWAPPGVVPGLFPVAQGLVIAPRCLPTEDAAARRCADGSATVTRQSARVGIEVVLGLPLLTAVVVMAERVGDTARFVTWPVVAFTVLAAALTPLRPVHC